MKKLLFAALASMFFVAAPSAAEVTIIHSGEPERTSFLEASDRSFFQILALDGPLFPKDMFDTDGEFVSMAADMRAVTAVPEPDVWTLLLLGFAGIGGLMRARHRPADDVVR